jgi:hypothetical protein
MVERHVLSDGTVSLKSGKCEFRYHRPRPGVVLIGIAGHDTGQFGTATMDELREDVVRYAPIELFIDMGAAHGPVLPVQEAWTDWFSHHRSALKSVSMLTRSKYMHVTAEIVKLFSRTGELIRVYLDDKPFHEALSRAAPGWQRPS